MLECSTMGSELHFAGRRKTATLRREAGCCTRGRPEQLAQVRSIVPPQANMRHSQLLSRRFCESCCHKQARQMYLHPIRSGQCRPQVLRCTVPVAFSGGTETSVRIVVTKENCSNPQCQLRRGTYFPTSTIARGISTGLARFAACLFGHLEFYLRIPVHVDP